MAEYLRIRMFGNVNDDIGYSLFHRKKEVLCGNLKR